MSEYIVGKRHKENILPDKTFKDLNEALLYCIHYDSLCQGDDTSATVVTNIHGEIVFEINHRGFYRVNKCSTPDEFGIIVNFIKTIGGN